MFPVGIIFRGNFDNRKKWLKNTEKMKEANKQDKIYVARSLRMHVLCCVTVYELHIRNASIA